MSFLDSSVWRGRRRERGDCPSAVFKPLPERRPFQQHLKKKNKKKDDIVCQVNGASSTKCLIVVVDGEELRFHSLSTTLKESLLPFVCHWPVCGFRLSAAVNIVSWCWQKNQRNESNSRREAWISPTWTDKRKRERDKKKSESHPQAPFVFGFPFFLRNNEFVLLRNTRPWTAVSHERSLGEDGILSFVGDR